MYKKLFFLAVFSLLIYSCASSRTTKNQYRKTSKSDRVVSNAFVFKGTKYKYGGTTKRGMDCSGIVFVAFGKENIKLPRISRDMAKQGKKISLHRAKKGDLVFFRTNKNRRRINHVGLITSVQKGTVKFIHSTSSRGVIISSLSEKYWKNAFVKAVNIL